MEHFDAVAWSASFKGDHVAEPAITYGTGGRRPNPVLDETFALASRVMDYAESLVRVNRVFADQILRSGTSVGSHTREAQGAESLRDFIHKMKIAYKELEETDYRSCLCHLKDHYPHDAELVRMTKALFPLFHSILSTSIQRRKRELMERRARRENR